MERTNVSEVSPEVDVINLISFTSDATTRILVSLAGMTRAYQYQSKPVGASMGDHVEAG